MLNPSASSPAASDSQRDRLFPLLLLLFIGSGTAALTYEIVWLQWLQLIVGSTSVSLAILLAIFMGGMCLGSLALPRLVGHRHHPLRVYALLEIGIALCGILILFGMPTVEQIYTTFGHGPNGVVLRAVLGGICLLPPTVLMGATLPAIARFVESSPRGVAWLGFFYGGNIVGAVVGCLLTGFYLLRVYDMSIATYVGVGINVVVAACALLLAPLLAYDKSVPQSDTPPQSRTTGARSIYLAIGISGMCSLGAEVTWTRLLSLILGGTVYSFSIILAVFLVGLGVGSGLGAFLSRTLRSPRGAFFTCQLLLVAGIAWTAHMMTYSVPYWPVDPRLSASPWFTFQLDLARVGWAILPATVLWGASFPLALAAIASRGKDTGQLVGSVYAANTLGSIGGALVFSALVGKLGTQHAQQVLLIGSFLAALVAFRPTMHWRQHPWNIWAAASVALVVAAVVWSITPVSWGVIAYGRMNGVYGYDFARGITRAKDIPTTPGSPNTYCLYVAEGTNVSVAVTQRRNGVRSFHGGGKVQASNKPIDMRLQRMLGHLPALVHPNPKSALVVACGAGVTAGSFIVHPEVKRIVICDIEPVVPTYVAPLFKRENHDVVGPANADRVEVIHDDGRHFIRTTQEKFDIITSDPIDPWVKGCAALNTVEYYQLCKQHLNPGGVMALWMPLYEMNQETLKSVIASFYEVFPNGTLWTNDMNTKGYDAILFGQVEPTRIDIDQIAARLDRPDQQGVKESLTEVGFSSIHQLLATYAGQATQMRPWSARAKLNTDRNLRLQYLAGMSLNTYMGEALLNGILKYYQFPTDIFTGSDPHMTLLKRYLSEAGRPDPLPFAAD
ncbi:MAG: SAM-dependent methyltransferase [Planctomycetaceae bacterium]|nr:SAM-dependent methyltransferase [Planctomycetaceae bacterium]